MIITVDLWERRNDLTKEQFEQELERVESIEKEEDFKTIEDFFKNNNYIGLNLKGEKAITIHEELYNAIVNSKLKVKETIQAIKDGDWCYTKKFETRGNIFKMVKEKYRGFARRISIITTGGNGGMANIGKGEWLFSLITTGNIVKEGNGDVILDRKRWEIKWNGGKIDVSDEKGENVSKRFTEAAKALDLDQEKYLKDFVPFRKKDKDRNNINELNAVWWSTLIGENNDGPLTTKQLKVKSFTRAINRLFIQIDRWIVFNQDGTYIKFKSAKDAIIYYSYPPILEKVKFECRAKKSNPTAMYAFVLD